MQVTLSRSFSRHALFLHTRNLEHNTYKDIFSVWQKKSVIENSKILMNRDETHTSNFPNSFTELCYMAWQKNSSQQSKPHNIKLYMLKPVEDQNGLCWEHYRSALHHAPGAHFYMRLSMIFNYWCIKKKNILLTYSFLQGSLLQSRNSLFWGDMLWRH